MNITITEVIKPTLTLVEHRLAGLYSKASVNISFCDTEEIVSITPNQIVIREVA